MPDKSLALLRLSFDDFESFTAWRETNNNLNTSIWRWGQDTGNQAEEIASPGVCDFCDIQTTYRIKTAADPHGDWQYRADYWMSSQCDCGKAMLDRSAMRHLMDGTPKSADIYHVGHFSVFRSWLSESYPNTTSSQYEAGRSSGEIVDGIRFESLTQLSFRDASFDAVVCMEVLEHIPDYVQAMREMARVLRPGGRAILSFPWLGPRREHLVRAEMRADGTINHILPPEYHGDPASAEGVLSFRAFGWNVLDELREAGFSRASTNFLFGPIHGYFNLTNPIIVATR